jgi:hypothetical protein
MMVAGVTLIMAIPSNDFLPLLHKTKKPACAGFF